MLESCPARVVGSAATDNSNPSLHHILTQRDIKTEKKWMWLGRVTYDHLLPLHKRQCLVTIIFTNLPSLHPRRACAARVTVVGSVCLFVCLFVCLSVTLYLTSRMSVHLKNDTVYLTGNEGQKL